MTDLLATFSALADSSRLRIMRLLRTMELSVGEIAQVLGQSQPRVSRHVRILCEAGLAVRRREGSWVFLAPAPSALSVPLFALLDAAAAQDGDHWAEADVARLRAVRADRARAAEKWFAAHAAEWDAIRSLHVPEKQVEAAMVELLGSDLGRLVDIGTGTGRMLELFAPQADSAIGVDRSPEMLRLARTKLDGHAVEFRQGDVAALPLADAIADTVVVHRVLQFLPAPESAIREIARLLSPTGRLLIADFAPHDLEHLRSEQGHARLGFSDKQVAGWLAQAGLELIETRSLPGSELTVKLWLARPRGAAAGANARKAVA